jgi:hypothetical protein
MKPANASASGSSAGAEPSRERRHSERRKRAARKRRAKGVFLERLVALLEAGLAEPGISVKARHRLRDLATGELREVDIYIEETLRGQVHPTIIECRHHKARVNVTYVEQVVTKRADLGNPHTIIVSHAGFTTGAVKKAQHHGIRLSTLKEVQDPLWPEWLAHGCAFELCPHTDIIWCGLLDEAGQFLTPPPELQSASYEDSVFIDANGKPQWSIALLVRRTIAASGLLTKIEDDQAMKQRFQLRARFDQPTFVKSDAGPRRVDAVCIEAELRYDAVPLPVSFSVYQDALAHANRGELAHVQLSNGTLLSVMKDPVTELMLMVANPPEGEGQVNLRVTLVAETSAGQDCTVTFPLSTTNPDMIPKVVLGPASPITSSPGPVGE